MRIMVASYLATFHHSAVLLEIIKRQRALAGQCLSLWASVGIGVFLSPTQVAGRAVEIAAGQCHHPIWTLMMAPGAVAAGLTLLALDLGLSAMAIIPYGAGNGIFYVARGTLPLAVFGADRYPALIGRLARPSLLNVVLSDWIFAMVLHQL